MEVCYLRLCRDAAQVRHRARETGALRVPRDYIHFVHIARKWGGKIRPKGS